MTEAQKPDHISIPALDMLEKELQAGARIIPIDDEHYNWKLENEEELICYGKTIRDLIVNLIMVRC